jgi:hypothetical protein
LDFLEKKEIFATGEIEGGIPACSLGSTPIELSLLLTDTLSLNNL